MEQKKTPLVSVVLTVYNRPEKVCKTIESILNQTFKDFELLIIDNASTDDTVERIKKFDDPRIRLIVNERNMGQTYSLNRGLDEAKGKYIARIDSDDIMLPKRLQKQVSFMEKHDDYVLCGAWVRFISDQDELSDTLKLCSTDKGLRFMQTFACGMSHPAAMFRRSTLEEHGIRYNKEVSIAEDYEMWFKLLEHGKGLNIPKVLIYYRKGEENDSVINKEISRKEGIAIRRNFYDQLNISDKKKARLHNEIDLEEKPNKNIIETCRVAFFYIFALNRNFKRTDRDYNILRLQIMRQIYGSCIFENERIYAKIIKKIWEHLKPNRE